MIAAAIAVVEFVALIALGVLVLARPLERTLSGRSHPQAAPARVGTVRRRSGSRPATASAARILPRDRVMIMVLNGNGVEGAAAQTAGRLHRLGYRIAGTANAARMNYAMSLVLYRPGYQAEGVRLARELHVRIVGPLDGMSTATLHGGEVAVILGN